jgi:hypothetical protein
LALLEGSGDVEAITGRPGLNAIDAAPGLTLSKLGVATDLGNNLVQSPIGGSHANVSGLPPVVGVAAHRLVGSTGYVYAMTHSPEGSADALAALRLHGSDWGAQDADGDGLMNAAEVLLGTDPYDPDTNHDGISDGDSVILAIDPISRDRDGDGVSNRDELLAGTAVDRADTDGDGVTDGQDAYPLDPGRSSPPSPTPGDTQPPTITLRTPTGAVLISSIPGGIE